MIKVTYKGDFKKTKKFLQSAENGANISNADKYGKIGVEALSSATPVDTGKTADSWTYSLVRTANSFSIIWKNTNIVDGVPIAIVLQYGHATGTGGYVQGRDYINPAIKPVFDKIEKEVWKEVAN